MIDPIIGWATSGLDALSHRRPPPEIRDDMREIFRRPEFQRTKSPITKALEWIGRQLGKLFPDVGPSSWGGPMPSIVGWAVLVVLAVVLVAILVTIFRRWRPTRRVDTPDVDIEIERYVSESEWASAAAEFEAAGEWKEAIRCRYRELVAALVDAALVGALPGRTTGELRGDVAAALPSASDAFHEATLLFELPWYADRPTGTSENSQFKELASGIRLKAASATPPPAPAELVEAT